MFSSWDDDRIVGIRRKDSKADGLGLLDKTTMDDNRFVTLTRTADFAAAQLICGYLESAGIPARIADEHVAGQVGFMSQALGGIRIQVREADRQAAETCLANLPDDEQSGQVTASPGDRLAQRALRTTLVGFFAMPFVHPYSFVLAWRALRSPDLSAPSRRQARVAAVVSAAVLIGSVTFLATLFLR